MGIPNDEALDIMGYYLKQNSVNGLTQLWKDPPFYSWVNQLFRLGHFQ